MSLSDALGDVIVLCMAVNVMEKTGLMGNTSTSRKKKGKKREDKSILDL